MAGSQSGALTYINLKIKYSPNGREVYFNVMRNSELKMIMIVSRDRLSLERNDIRFVYKGHYVPAEATPDELEMEDGDVIDAISVRPRNQLTADPGMINIVVRGWCQIREDQDKLYFRIKRNTKLKKLMTAYCDRCSLHDHCVCFLFDGRRLRDDDTADELQMIDGEEIDVFVHQPGCVKCGGD